MVLIIFVQKLGLTVLLYLYIVEKDADTLKKGFGGTGFEF